MGTKRLTIRATAALAALAWGCGKPADADSTRGVDDARPVHVEPVARQDVEEVLVYAVDLEPSAEVRIYSMISETIVDFPWQDGDRVEKGQRIALIRKNALTKGMAQAAAQLEGLDVQIGSLGDQLERSRPLLSGGAMSQNEYDKLESSYLSMVAQRKAMSASKGQLADQVGKATISAPISGVVAFKAYEVGDMASPAVPLCRILAVDELKARLDLVEEDVPKVHMGQEVHLVLDAYPGRIFSGRITSILPYLDPATRTNAVEVTLANPADGTGERMLKPGMFGKAEIVVARHENAVVAPGVALLMDDLLLDSRKPGQILRRAFAVGEDGKASERVVEIGIRQGSAYEILSGLEEGEKLVVRGQHGLVDGQAVRVVEAEK
jgi:RND family efflux transporter MFP subunit